MVKEMLTADNLAEYLQVSKNQIYRLLKEKRLPGTRITGKWLFPKQLIDEWIVESAKRKEDSHQQSDEALAKRVVIAGSNDLALELLTKSVQMQTPDLTLSLSNTGSLAGLFALRKGTCHLAASHLLDTETGEYNSSVIKKKFPDLKVQVVSLVHREQGLLLRKGNPLGIKNLQDLVNKRAVFLNRQEGSGTRVLLDFKLLESQIDPMEIPGYATKAPAYTHIEVGLAVLGGTADAGMGIRAVAALLDLDFIPVATERFDLIIPNKYHSSKAVASLLKALRLDELKTQVNHMGGYKMGQAGKVIYEAG
jgi:putative molybdopterin biosynthesis protein